MGRVEYLNDPAAPRPNSLVPVAGVLAVDEHGRILLRDAVTSVSDGRAAAELAERVADMTGIPLQHHR